MTIPITEQIECVKRELGLRRRVYAWRVREGKMTELEAATETARMQAVLATLEGIKAANEPELGF